MQVVQVALRALQFFFTLVITALIGNAIHEAVSGNPSSVNFAMFVAVLSWVALIAGAAAAFVEAIPGMIIMAIDGIATLFTFIAAVVLSAKLGVHSCSNQGYLLHNNLTNGSHNMGKRCHELQASTAFYWFLFATFVASLVMGFLNRGSGVNIRGIGRRGPSMSQV